MVVYTLHSHIKVDWQTDKSRLLLYSHCLTWKPSKIFKWWKSVYFWFRYFTAYSSTSLQFP